MNLPVFALAVRQPWAWALIHAGKDMENRSWKRWKRDWKHRGRIAILASKGMTKEEYVNGYCAIRDITQTLCPPAGALIRGAIIGTIEIVDNVWESNSPWFFGPGAFVIAHPEPIIPIPCDGQLDIFKWKPAYRGICEPAKWMMPKPEAML